MPKKLKIPTQEQKRLNVLETENADLWFDNVMLKSQATASTQEIADLWFQILVGGEA